MKIGFVVNDIKTEEPSYTTTRLAMTAVNLGHRCYAFGVGAFMYAANGSIHARRVPPTARPTSRWRSFY